MNHKMTNLRFFLPLVASGLLSFALCAAMAAFLYGEQETSAAAVDENIRSNRAAANLEEALTNLVALLQNRGEGVAALNDRVEQHVADAQHWVDHPQEKDLADRVEESFQRYLAIWRGLSERPGTEREARIRDALHVIESETLIAAHELRKHNTQRIESANEHHTAMLRKLSWGLAAIGGSAGIAGIFLGFGVARGLSRSIQRVQVRVQDAAGLLGREFPSIEVSGDANLENLDRQVQVLVGRIEETVEQLRQRDREVRRAEQLAAVGQIAAGMAHEIRNPLTSIKMLIQAASEDAANGLPSDDLAVIEREIRRVEQLLQTFLDFARPPKPSKAATDLATVIRETLELTRGRAAKQRVAFTFQPPLQSVTVNADPTQLRQVLVNLVLNSLDAMPGGGSLTIDLSAVGSTAVIHVTDSGPGIAADFQHRLFEPFVSTRETGLGLGLVICRRIVEDHGGSIEGQNAIDGGARFTVKLPRIVSASANGAAAKRADLAKLTA